MMRPPFVGHRRYSITHRAVQRLRELVPGRDEEDDESLRDRLDEALGTAEDTGKATRTLDAMLGEPQTLIPVDTFGDVLYAIIKEDTVVTVLPQGHGQEILQRGQAMEQRVASGQAPERSEPSERAERPAEKERWTDGPRRRWQKDSQPPVVVQRVSRGNGLTPSASASALPPGATPRPASSKAHASSSSAASLSIQPRAAAGALSVPASPATTAPPRKVITARPPGAVHSNASDLLVKLPERPKLEDPLARSISDALDRGRRSAAVIALRDALEHEERTASLLPLWNALAAHGIPGTMTVGDLIDAVQQSQRS